MVTSPLQDIRSTEDIAQSCCPYAYGTYHQLYRLNGKLIAVGVVDLLPSGLSSVYVFYDNDYRELTLGKYSALKEIEFCSTHKLPCYYMGYYIHNCPKMRYKAEYRPSELLCPTSLRWYPLESHCNEILDKYKFSPFDRGLAAERAALGELPTPENSGNNNKNDIEHSDVDKEADQETSKEEGIASDSIGNNESEEDEEEKIRASLEKLGDKRLDIFRPQFPSFVVHAMRSAASTASATNSKNGKLVKVQLLPEDTVPLDIGQDRLVYLWQLGPQARFLAKFLNEWIEHVGGESGAAIPISIA